MQTPTPRLLFVLAHPDDESFGSGALIARYTRQGAQVSLICATNGDVGTVDAALLNGYGSVAELRLAELKRASDILGFHEVVLLGYRDSGMMGSPTTEAPESLWHTWQTDPETVIRRVTAEIRRLKPQVVVTFNRYGGYGHPDHIAIQRATVEAFTRAADPDYAPEIGAPYAPQKLYYSNIPTLFVQLGIWTARLRGQNPRALGTNKDIDLVAILDHVEPTHTRVNIADYSEIGDQASAAHVSQGGGRVFRLPFGLRRLLTGWQGFTRVHPAPTRAGIDEDDLFAGVTLD